MKNIFDVTLNELEIELVSNGFKKYNATQIFNWLYKKRVNNFLYMKNISKSLIEYLNNNYYIKYLTILNRKSNDKSIKFLFLLEDGNKIESVVLKHNYGNSICVSSQVGCNMGCSFCESGRLKKVRNLSLSEMVLQVLTASINENINIHSVVVMGIGEPFDNFEILKRFINVIMCDQALCIGQRHITISTCGIVPKIYEFADLDTQVNLAVSLHAPNNKTRSELMKINDVYNIEDIFKSLDYYIKKTNRKVTIEYILINGINDSISDAEALSKLLKGKLMYVNLIPYNETSNFTYKRSNKFKIKQFCDILKKNNIYVVLRKDITDGLDAACGQLRAKEN